MIGAFSFEHGGRTYNCAPEKRITPPVGTWWWFTVSSDSNRYAPFEAVSGDTRQSIQNRVVAYYEHRLHVRSQPAAPRQHFGRPSKPGARPGQPGKS